MKTIYRAGQTRFAAACLLGTAVLAQAPVGARAEAVAPREPIDVSFRENQAGPVFGHYPAGTPIVREFTNPQFPESTHFDAAGGYLFVSSIHGLGLVKDGNGWIGRVRLGDPNDTLKPWVRGLNGPKGMRAHNGTLWVADIDEVVAVEMATGRVEKRIKVGGARFLNDVAVDAAGRIYVSDTFTNTIFRIMDGAVEAWEAGGHLEGPNGLLVDGDRLLVAALGPTGPDFRPKHPGRLFAINIQTKERTPIHRQPFGNLDGIEKYDADHYLVSDWQQGKIFIVDKDGSSRTLIRGILGAADIGFDPERKWVAIPRMAEDRVSVVSVAHSGKPAPAARPVDPKWEKGRLLSASCTACHGQVDNPSWPRLDGQGKQYLAKALTDFRQGHRENALMSPMARALTDADIDSLATFYSSRRVPAVKPGATDTDHFSAPAASPDSSGR